MGEAGSSQDCMEAVMKLVQFGDPITRARILTCPREESVTDHALLLTLGEYDLVAIKSGFASGYLGQGSHTFSYVLQLLDTHGVEIEEYNVDEAFVERLDHSVLTRADLEHLDKTSPIRFPTRWHSYVFEDDFERTHAGRIWDEFPPVIPFAIIEGRITDLAVSFWENPNAKLLTGFSRLEDVIRERTGSDSHGYKLFSQAFLGEEPQLEWKGLDEAEKKGRATLFTGAFMAFRNRRAHRELKDNPQVLLSEFLLLNLLFQLEKETTPRDS
jgi:hypothetical protein